MALPSIHQSPIRAMPHHLRALVPRPASISNVASGTVYLWQCANAGCMLLLLLQCVCQVLRALRLSPRLLQRPLAAISNGSATITVANPSNPSYIHWGRWLLRHLRSSDDVASGARAVWAVTAMPDHVLLLPVSAVGASSATSVAPASPATRLAGDR
jgi:hypothetical protein